MVFHYDVIKNSSLLGYDAVTGWVVCDISKECQELLTQWCSATFQYIRILRFMCVNMQLHTQFLDVELCSLQLHHLDLTTGSLCFLTKTPVCISVWYTWLQETTTGSTHLSNGMSSLGDISMVRSSKLHLELVVPQGIMSKWNSYKASLALPCYIMFVTCVGYCEVPWKNLCGSCRFNSKLGKLK